MAYKPRGRYRRDRSFQTSPEDMQKRLEMEIGCVWRSMQKRRKQRDSAEDSWLHNTYREMARTDKFELRTLIYLHTGRF